MADDVLLRKATSIERCLQRIHAEYTGKESQLDTNFLLQDSVILNLQRACELAIDAAMHMVRIKKLGLPDEARQAFQLLVAANALPLELGRRLERMVGFRNTAIHQYQTLNMAVVRSILNHHLDDFRQFVAVMINNAS